MARKKIFRKHRSSRLFWIFFLTLSLPYLVLGTQTARQLTSKAQSFSCPATSTQTYGNLGLKGHEIENELPIEQNSDINISLRGYEEVSEKPELVDYGGDTDPNMPPSLGTFFTRTPTIVKTYRVHQWDFAGKTRKPELETSWPVSVIGLATNPGESLVGLKAGREIGGGYILMVIYATKTSITFNYSDDESGYPIYLDNLCVDPNLVAAYEAANAAGRSALPAIRTGQVFGYGNGSDLRIAIRDTGTWMDPRSRKDWWQGSTATSGSQSPPTNNNPSPLPTLTPEINNPTVTPLPLPQATNKPTSGVASPTPPIVIHNIIYVSPTALPVTPTVIPTPTPIPFNKTLHDRLTWIRKIWENILRRYLP